MNYSQPVLSRTAEPAVVRGDRPWVPPHCMSRGQVVCASRRGVTITSSFSRGQSAGLQPMARLAPCSPRTIAHSRTAAVRLVRPTLFTMPSYMPKYGLHDTSFLFWAPLQCRWRRLTQIWEKPTKQRRAPRTRSRVKAQLRSGTGSGGSTLLGEILAWCAVLGLVPPGERAPR